MEGDTKNDHEVAELDQWLARRGVMLKSLNRDNCCQEGDSF
jgi:hypothetical protein